MKRFLLLITMCLFLSGCSQEKYEQLQADYEKSKSDYTSLQDKYDSLQADYISSQSALKDYTEKYGEDTNGAGPGVVDGWTYKIFEDSESSFLNEKTVQIIVHLDNPSSNSINNTYSNMVNGVTDLAKVSKLSDLEDVYIKYVDDNSVPIMESYIRLSTQSYYTFMISPEYTDMVSTALQ